MTSHTGRVGSHVRNSEKQPGSHVTHGDITKSFVQTKKNVQSWQRTKRKRCVIDHLNTVNLFVRSLAPYHSGLGGSVAIFIKLQQITPSYIFYIFTRAALAMRGY